MEHDYVKDSSPLQTALALRENGKYREALQIFQALANQSENTFEKAGMLLNIVNTLQGSGELELARNQLGSVRLLLADASHLESSQIPLIIGAELEDIRIAEAEGNFEEAVRKCNELLRQQEEFLKRPGCAELYWAVLRELGFALTHKGAVEQALCILEQVNHADPHDKWTTYYLGTCYSYSEKNADAIERLEESIALDLPKEFAGRAHFRLGAAYYQLGDYGRAKGELEVAVKTAPPEFIQHEGIWRWLQYTCIKLGLKKEAEYYANLARNPN